MKVIRKIGAFIIIFLRCSCFAQNGEITNTLDFSKWCTIENGKFSENGRWFAHKKSNTTDSLYIVNTKTNQTRTWLDVKQFDFLTDNVLGLKTEDYYFYVDLEVNDVQRIDVKGRTLWQRKNGFIWKDMGSIGFYHRIKKKNFSIPNVTSLKMNPENEWGVFTKKIGDSTIVYYLSVSDWKQEQIAKIKGELQYIVFGENEKSAVFATKSEDNNITLYALISMKSNFIIKKMATEPNGKIVPHSLTFDSKNKKCYFYVIENSLIKEDLQKDILTFDSLDKEQNLNQNKRYVWDLKTDSVFKLAYSDLTAIIPTGMNEVYVGYKSEGYDPRDNNGLSFADFYIVNETGSSNLIAKKVPLLYHQFLIAPHSNYLAYFHNGNWWSYDLKSNTNRCLTATLNTSFENTRPKYPYSVKHYETMGWSADGKELWIYDQYDIWRVALNGRYIDRITKGREQSLKFRHDFEKALLPVSFIAHTQFETKIIQDTQQLLLTAYQEETEQQALYFLDKKEIIQISPLDKQRVYFSKIRSHKINFKTESFNQFPFYTIYDITTGKKWSTKEISNSKENKLGKTSILKVKVNDSIQLRGVLLYPANWNSDKKYPLVVSVYDQEASKVNYFKAPTLENTSGFNPTIYTLNDYFVFYPNLRYQNDNVLHYVQSDLDLLLDKVITEEPTVDNDRLGIIGHSFGGFQVMYLIGQTNRFKAAVAGAGVSDLIDFYFTEHGKGGIGMFAFEFAQYRSKMPFGNSNILLNSPINFAHKITTPLFLWSGTEDTQVHYRNSEKMYKALWRQKKEVYLTLYDKELHALDTKKNQVDLSFKIMQFFDSKLK